MDEHQRQLFFRLLTLNFFSIHFCCILAFNRRLHYMGTTERYPFGERKSETTTTTITRTTGSFFFFLLGYTVSSDWATDRSLYGMIFRGVFCVFFLCRFTTVLSIYYTIC
ncbi:hypothetical protein QBC38DRAFT_471526 [Podospora fimiseda]|uniref:Uncharacterized protein n=1 Tax=Podospora fimiseda TaxID=252190 RepID=A0AAN7BUK4_9PEZI|nr:hypothetical protein QBC38DRAFT_471526 [Podospora fimiseda]